MYEHLHTKPLSSSKFQQSSEFLKERRGISRACRQKVKITPRLRIAPALYWLFVPDGALMAPPDDARDLVL